MVEADFYVADLIFPGVAFIRTSTINQPTSKTPNLHQAACSLTLAATASHLCVPRPMCEGELLYSRCTMPKGTVFVVVIFSIVNIVGCHRGTSNVPAVERAAVSLPPQAPESLIVDAYLRGDAWGGGVEGQALSEDEEAAVNQALGRLPEFPKNAFNGCQARAHAVFSAINAVSNGKAYKVWLLGGDLISAVLMGHISYQTSESQILWDFHVAVAFSTKAKGIQVVDGLTSKQPRPLREWVAGFRQNGLVVLTYTAGIRYLYNTYSVPLYDNEKTTHSVLNRFYAYDGISAQAHEGAKAIAADALTIAFRTGRFSSCSTFGLLANGNQAIKLSNEVSMYVPFPSFLELDKHQNANRCGGAPDGGGRPCPPFVVPPRPAPPDGCAEPSALFQTELEKWIRYGL